MAKRVVKVTWYEEPEQASRDLVREYRALTPNQRVEEVFRLMELVAGWKRHGRLDRTARFVEVV